MAEQSPPPPPHKLTLNATVRVEELRRLLDADLPPDGEIAVQLLLTAQAQAAPSDEPMRTAAVPVVPPAAWGKWRERVTAGWEWLLGWQPALRARLLCLIAAFALAFQAQNLFEQAAGLSISGLIVGLLAAPCFFLAIPRDWLAQPYEDAAAPPATFPPIAEQTWRIGLLAAVAIGLNWLLRVLAATTPDQRYGWTLPFWLLLIAAFGLAVLPRIELAGLRAAWPPRNWLRPPLLLLGAILLAGAGLRLVGLDWAPYTLSGDEGNFGLETIRVLRGEISNPFITGHLGVPTMTFFFQAPAVALFGNEIAVVRTPWALMGVLNILLVFLLVRRLYDERLGLLAAALVAGYHYHLHYSRLALNNIADPFFTTLALWLLYRAFATRHPRDWFFCGVAVAIAQYFYFGARLIAVVIVVSAAVYLLNGGWAALQRHWRGLSLATVSGLLAAAPLIQFAIRFPDIYNSRVNQTGIFQNGWIEREQALRGLSVFELLREQFWKAALAFNAVPDRSPWYAIPTPLLETIPAALLILGLGLALLLLLNPRLFPLIAWWGGTILTGGMLTDSPPASQRLVTTAVPTMILIAVVIALTWRALRATLNQPLPTWLAPLAATGLVAWLSWPGLSYYFSEYRERYTYGSYNGLVSTELGYYSAEELGPNWRIYFFAAPRMWFGFGSNRFLAPDVLGEDVAEPLTAPPDPSRFAGDRDLAFVFLPERIGDLAQIKAAFPGGIEEQIPSPLFPEPLFTIYRVDRSGI